MRLENQVVNLKLSQKLKKLGVKQESLFYYNSKTVKLQKGFTCHIDKKGKMRWSISAFTVAELAEILPEGIKVYKLANEWFCEIKEQIMRDRFEINARAKMLIYLIENKLINP